MQMEKLLSVLKNNSNVIEPDEFVNELYDNGVLNDEELTDLFYELDIPGDAAWYLANADLGDIRRNIVTYATNMLLGEGWFTFQVMSEDELTEFLCGLDEETYSGYILRWCENEGMRLHFDGVLVIGD